MEKKKVGDYYLYFDKLLGKGAFGQVVLGKRIDNNAPVAVKIIQKQLFEGKQQFECTGFKKSIQREVVFQKTLNHKNIIQMYEAKETKNNIYMFMELGDCTLLEYQQKNKLNDEDIKKIMKQLLQALQYMANFKLTNPLQNNKQYYGICHLDLKPQNILMIGNTPKITDFGMSIQINQDQISEIETTSDELSLTHHFYLGKGSLKYMSYEQLLGEQIPELEKIDVWSLGVILYEIIYGKHPYIQGGTSQLNQIKIANMFQENNIEFPPTNYNKEVIDLIKGMLQLDYSKRFNLRDCLNHPFFN
ncbi:unnamed protein product [Paramecium primaurelia]|uniref:Protein kinase domain-containing protein n=1 Tax=Paramecium primaurelia TaxID=5886 RepID=A0A8S1L6Z3_PARPR|nr:unnamed protein product [Paramecium primaurelia]